MLVLGRWKTEDKSHAEEAVVFTYISPDPLSAHLFFPKTRQKEVRVFRWLRCVTLGPDLKEEELWLGDKIQVSTDEP